MQGGGFSVSANNKIYLDCIMQPMYRPYCSALHHLCYTICIILTVEKSSVGAHIVRPLPFYHVRSLPKDNTYASF